MKKFKTLLSFAIALCSVGVLSSGGMEVKKVEAEAASGTFNLVTDASTLAVGDKIIIASGCSGACKALSTTQNENNRKETSSTITVVENKIVDLKGSIEAELITLEKGTVDGTFALKVSDGYLYSASSKKNYLKTQTSVNANGSWAISIKNKIATVQSQGTNTKNLLSYNGSKALFSSYSSVQGNIYLYELEEGTAIVQYTVSFDTDGGTVISDKVVSEGEKISRPVDPEKEGYKFGGWYSDSSYTTLFDFDSVISEDTTIYAKWIEKNIGELFSENTNVEGALSFGFEYVGKSRSDVISIENLEMDEQGNAYDNIRESTIKGTTTKLSSGFYVADKTLIQTNKGKKCFIKNTTAFSDEIKAVMINWNQAPAKLDIYGAIDSEPNIEKYDCKVQTSAEKNARVDITTKGIKYLYIDLNTNITQTSKISSIDIIYDEPSITNFRDMSLNFKTDYDFTGKVQGTDFTEAGMMIVKGSDVSATYSKKTANALPEGAIKAAQKDYEKEFIVRLEDIPVKDWATKVTVVPYILLGGTYYFGIAGVTSVIETAAKYISSNATITLSDESVVNVKDVAVAIKSYYDSLGE